MVTDIAMLGDLIEKYEKAMSKNDKKGMDRIERQLASVGMDRRSLLAIVEERRNNGERKA